MMEYRADAITIPAMLAPATVRKIIVVPLPLNNPSSGGLSNSTTALTSLHSAIFIWRMQHKSRVCSLPRSLPPISLQTFICSDKNSAHATVHFECCPYTRCTLHCDQNVPDPRPRCLATTPVTKRSTEDMHDRCLEPFLLVLLSIPINLDHTLPAAST